MLNGSQHSSDSDTTWGVTRYLLASCLALGFWGFPIFAMLRGSDGDHSIFSWHIVSLAVLSQLLVHELGHLSAGLLHGFRFLALGVFPFCVNRFEGRWTVEPFFASGIGACAPTELDVKGDLEKLRDSLFWHLIMGPLVGITCSAICIVVWMLLLGYKAEDSYWIDLLGAAGIFGLLINLTNWFARDSSDRLNVKALGREHSGSISSALAIAATHMILAGESLELFDRRLRALMTAKEISEVNRAYGLYYACLAAQATQDLEEASGYLKQLQTMGKQLVNSELLPFAQAELGYFAAIHWSDLELANKCLSGIGLVGTGARLRLETAIAVQEGVEVDTDAIASFMNQHHLTAQDRLYRRDLESLILRSQEPKLHI